MFTRIKHFFFPALKQPAPRPQAIRRRRINPVYLLQAKKPEGVANIVGVRITEERK